jgi:hypothetical protein
VPTPARLPALLAAAALPALAGCGGSGGDGGDGDAPAPVRPAPAASSRTDLRPPGIVVFERSARTAPGLLLVGPKKVFGARKRPGDQQGPMLVDDAGRVRWFKPLPGGEEAYDLRVQRYRGRPVITWWQGQAVNGSGRGVGMIYDTRYRRVARVESGTGADADIHEFLLTPQGTALMIVYDQRRRDLRRVGGKRRDRIVEGIVREVDVETGRVLFEWRGLDHLDITESYESIRKRYGVSWDYLHLNSIDVDTDGHLLLSARHTWAAYKIHRRTGRVIWRLGGKRSSFRMARDLRFSWQHDARAQGRDRVRIFDNAAASKPVRPESRVITLDLDRERRRATRVQQIEHPRRLSAGTQANAQRLANGHTVVGWGSRGHFSEFDRRGRMLFDARVQRGYDTYRAYRERWTATPAERPALAAERRGRVTVVHASWNGSTQVRLWQVLAGSRPGRLTPVGRPAPWDGLETTVRVATGARYVAVRALDGAGRVLRVSRTVRVRGG